GRHRARRAGGPGRRQRLALARRLPDGDALRLHGRGLVQARQRPLLDPLPVLAGEPLPRQLRSAPRRDQLRPLVRQQHLRFPVANRDRDRALDHGRLRLRQVRVPAEARPLLPGDRHPDPAALRNPGAALRDDGRPRVDGHLPGAHPAVHRPGDRGVPGATATAGDPERAAGGGPDRRRRGVVDLHPDRPAAGATGDRGDGDHLLHGVMERLPVAADRRPQRREVHRQPGAGDADRPVQPGVRGGDGGVVHGHPADRPHLPALPAPLHRGDHGGGAEGI
ncbi:MAG: ABC transporter, permease protein 2 (cluster 1, maltose/g3p/polyamine/iron), partial [uncultured Thermomicrobiales bacterium]